LIKLSQLFNKIFNQLQPQVHLPATGSISTGCEMVSMTLFVIRGTCGPVFVTFARDVDALIEKCKFFIPACI